MSKASPPPQARWDQASSRWEASRRHQGVRYWGRSKRPGPAGKAEAEAKLQAKLDQAQGLPTLPPDSLAAFIEQVYWPAVAPSLAAETADRYRSIINNDIHPISGATLDELRIEVLAPWLSCLIATAGRTKTVRNKVGVLTSILNFAHDAGRVTHTDWKLLRVPRREQNLQPAVTLAQTQALLTQAQGTPYFGPIFAAAFLGLRLNEVLGLQPENLSQTAQGWILEVQFNRQYEHGTKRQLKGKNPGESRRLALPEPFAQALLAASLPFRGEYGGLLDPKTLSKAVPRLAAQAGIKTRVSMQILRHSCATNLREAGVPETLIQSILGHSGLATTLHYLNQRDDEVLAAFHSLLSRGVQIPS